MLNSMTSLKILVKICFALAFLMGFTFIFSDNTYALDDYSINVDVNTVYICDNSSSSIPHCSDYDYLVLSDFSESDLNTFYSYAFYVNNNRYGGSVRPTGVSLLSISDNVTKIELGSGASGRTFKATLTNTFGAPCDCPPIPDCDTPQIIQDFRDVFFAIVTYVIPAFGVIVVVWFGIDMMSSLFFGRGK